MEAIYLILLIMAGIVVLQVFLSKLESRWPGLVLPILAFLIGTLAPILNMVAPEEGGTIGFIFEMLFVCLLSNIPTIVFLGIYFGCRAKHRRNKQLEKTNIQDLD